MQGLNKKQRNLVELHISQYMYKHTKGGVDIIMSKFNTPINLVQYYQMCT